MKQQKQNDQYISWKISSSNEYAEYQFSQLQKDESIVQWVQ